MMGKEGFINENEMCVKLNRRKFSELNRNIKLFLQFANQCKKITPDEIITCRKKGGWSKADLSIRIGSNDPFTVSLKTGQANSVHQEPIEDFINYLSQTFHCTDDLKNDLRFFIWGDGTLDGNSEKRNRLSAIELKREYPDKINRLKMFFKQHVQEFIERFVMKGPKSSIAPDFIYYGDIGNGLWASSPEVFRFLSDPRNEARSVIPVGRLTFQAWNRALKQNSRSEHKRGVIQLKWPTLEKDLITIGERRGRCNT